MYHKKFRNKVISCQCYSRPIFAKKLSWIVLTIFFLSNCRLSSRLNLSDMSLKKKRSLNPQQGGKKDEFNEDSFSQSEQYSNYYSPGEMGMFQEFKIQYDLLRRNYEIKVKEVDSLNYDKKKLELEVMNSNQAFYQRENSRLKFEVERYQEENQENKHKYLIAENMKRQFEGTLKAKNKEAQHFIKQLEKEKISTAELKHQNAEKDRKFKSFVSQMQSSNNFISEDYEKASAKVSQLESQLRIKSKELDSSQRDLEKLTKKLQGSESTLANSKQAYELKNRKQELAITEIERQYRDLKNSTTSEIERLTYSLNQTHQKLTNQDILVSKKFETAKIFKETRQMEIDIRKISEELTQANYQIAAGKQLSKRLQKELKLHQNSEDIKNMEITINALEKKNNLLKKEYQDKIIFLEQELERIKLQSYTNPAENNAIPRNFQQLLRTQIEENSNIKNQLETKVDDIFNLKSDLEEQKLKLKSLESEITIIKRKQKSQEKNQKIDKQIALQNMKNDFQSLKRKLELSENKLLNKTREVKEKDSFITTTIIGRSRQEDVPSIMADLQRIFQADYVAKLCEAKETIELMKKSETVQ